MLETVTDIHLFDGKLEDSIVFPGPARLQNEWLPMAADLLERCRACKKLDFMITVGGRFFRGHKETRAVDGTWFHLRQMPSNPPSLDTLPSRLPTSIAKLLLSKSLSSGGLVYIVGGPGQGKTTTASAMVVSRLKEAGGFAYTVEDPPEMPLNGWHGDGVCRQTWVAGDSIAEWAESLRGVLRSQPVGTPTILFVGEVRDAESARALIRAASNGFLVVATGFGTDIVSGIEALTRLADDGSESMLIAIAGVLRVVIHQRIINGALAASVLASRDGKSAVAAKLRTGGIQHLLSDIQFQSNQLLLGQDIFEVA